MDWYTQRTQQMVFPNGPTKIGVWTRVMEISKIVSIENILSGELHQISPYEMIYHKEKKYARKSKSTNKTQEEREVARETDTEIENIKLYLWWKYK